MKRLLVLLLTLFFLIAPQTTLAQTEYYPLTEESTFLTFPEWYIVFSAQEYAEFLKTGRPSQFDYLNSVKTYWETYYKVTKTTIDEDYPFNFGNHLMLGVIGISYTGEYLAKALYESTAGAASEQSANYEKTPEDLYAQEVAYEYGQFLTHTPWFDFPFHEKLKDLWTKTPAVSDSPKRSLERKIALSIEYEFKALYGALMHYATNSVYAPAKPEITAKTSIIPQEKLNNPEIKVIDPGDGKTMTISLPRYKKFSEIVPALLRENIQFYEIENNDVILITATGDKNWQYNLDAKLLFETPIFSDKTKKRLALQVPVEKLHLITQALEANHFTIEHLFDY